MSMSYTHYFKPEGHERVYDADTTLHNYGYRASSFGPVSPHGIAIKQEPRDVHFDGGKHTLHALDTQTIYNTLTHKQELFKEHKHYDLKHV